jgi:energy-coupling factor transporter transmembrane protein EcfT
METGVGVALGAALMAIAYGIQRFKVLPKVIRMRVVAILALVGVAAAIVPSILGTWARQGIGWCITQLANFVGQYDGGWASFIRVWLLPILFLGACVIWLGKLLPGAAARFTGEVASNEFDDDDNATVWGGALVIGLLWASSSGPLGDFLRTPIGALVGWAGPAAANLLQG